MKPLWPALVCLSVACAPPTGTCQLGSCANDGGTGGLGGGSATGGDGGSATGGGGGTGGDGGETGLLARGVAYLNRDVQGRLFVGDAGTASICPPGWEYAGGTWDHGAVCVAPTYYATAEVTKLADGTDTITSQPGATSPCPPGWALLGHTSYYTQFIPVCGRTTPTTVFFLVADTLGHSYPDDLPNAADVCPPGATHLGSFAYYTVCALPGALATLYLTHDAQGRSHATIGDVCPAGTVYRGIQFHPNYAACTTSAPATFAALTRAASGGATTHCPAGFDYVGGNGAAACLRSAINTVAWLTSNAQGQSFPADLSDETAVCPRGWTYLGGQNENTVCMMP